MNKKFDISIRISLKFAPKGPIDNNSAVVQVMAWRRVDDKLLSEPIVGNNLNSLRPSDAYMRQ